MNDDNVHTLRPEAHEGTNPLAARRHPHAGGPSAPIQPASASAEPATGGILVAEPAISRAITRLLHEHTGSGPRNARTVFTSELAVVTVRDSLTMAEKTLAGRGHVSLVLRTRALIHEAIREEAMAAVQRIARLHVVACLSDQSYDPDLAIIVFVFGGPLDGSPAA